MERFRWNFSEKHAKMLAKGNENVNKSQKVKKSQNKRLTEQKELLYYGQRKSKTKIAVERGIAVTWESVI